MDMEADANINTEMKKAEILASQEPPLIRSSGRHQLPMLVKTSPSIGGLEPGPPKTVGERVLEASLLETKAEPKAREACLEPPSCKTMVEPNPKKAVVKRSMGELPAMTKVVEASPTKTSIPPSRRKTGLRNSCAVNILDGMPSTTLCNCGRKKKVPFSPSLVAATDHVETLRGVQQSSKKGRRANKEKQVEESRVVDATDDSPNTGRVARSSSLQ